MTTALMMVVAGRRTRPSPLVSVQRTERETPRAACRSSSLRLSARSRPSIVGQERPAAGGDDQLVVGGDLAVVGEHDLGVPDRSG